MADSGVIVHFPHAGDMQASMFSDIFAQIQSKFRPSHSETGFHDPSARDAAISTVDKGIESAMQFVRSLLMCRNSLAPISLLPTEMLARVFHFLLLEEPPLSEKRSLGWIRVTHVCRRWRQVAIDDSSLWARIWCMIRKNNKWIPEILDRAKNVPLDIELNFTTRPSPEVFLMLPPHLSHTRQLRLHSLSTGHSKAVRRIYSCEAPVLEHFKLTVNVAYHVSSLTMPDLGGKMLFKGHAPRLRTFSLSGVFIPWSLIPRGQLTQLKIAHIDEVVKSPGDLNELIDLLVNCPSLEILALKSCLPSQLTGFSRGQTIHLPRLSRLRLCGSPLHIMNMLRMLKLPSLIALHLNCISDATHNNSEALLFPVISAQFRSPTPVEFKSLTVSIRFHMSSSLNITASTFPSTMRNCHIQNDEGNIVGNPELVLSFVNLSKHYSKVLLKDACKMLPISNLEFISMSTVSSTILDDINWAELFSCCTNVITMQANGQGTSSLVRALTAPTATNAGSSMKLRKRKYDNRERTVAQPANTVAHAHTVIFPKLKFLGLTDLNFSDGKHNPARSSGIEFEVFERGLQQRVAASKEPLELLRIINCNIDTQKADDLGKLVKEFYWDEGRRHTTGKVPFVDRDPLIWSSEDDYTGTDDSDEW